MTKRLLPIRAGAGRGAVLLFAVCFFLTSFTGRAASPDRFQKVTLKNGLTVLYKVMKGYPMVSLNAVFPVGMNQEKEKGIAHLLEHMVFRGGSGNGFPEIAAATIRKGGSFSGATSFEATTYNYVVPKETVIEGLRIFNGSIWKTDFSEAHVALERRIVLHELDLDYSLRYQVYPVFRYFFPEFSYTKETVARIASPDLQKFHLSFYQPENATYILAGDFDLKTVLAELEKVDNGYGHQQVVRPEVREFDLPRGEVAEERNLYPYQFQVLMAYQFNGLSLRERLILRLLAGIYGYSDRIDYLRNEYQIYNTVSRSVGNQDYFGIFYLERNQPYSEAVYQEQKAQIRKFIRQFQKVDVKKEIKNLINELNLEIAQSQNSPEDAASYQTQRIMDHDALSIDALPELKRISAKDLTQFIAKYLNQPPTCWILVKNTKADGGN